MAGLLIFANGVLAQHAEFLGAPLAPTAGTELPAGFYVENAAPGSSFVLPVAVAFAPDGRIFVAEKRGVVWIIEHGQVLPQPFIDLRAEVMSHYDRGLLGITLHPDFEHNGYVYLLYTVDHDGTGSWPRQDAFSRLTRYTASAHDPNRADPFSRHVLIGRTFADGIPACYDSHVIGTVLFGGDGSLLVGSGDAASFAEVDAGGLYPECFGAGRIDAVEDIGAYRAQYLGSMAGKILRIHPETGDGLPGNPFFTGNPTDNASRVWMLGLRNPFRFSIADDGIADPASAWPGTLYVGNVGWYNWEEINVGYGGENFGWPCFEGLTQHRDYWEASSQPAHSDCFSISQSHTPPSYYFHHREPDRSLPAGLQGSTIVVGDIYYGTAYPEALRGRLFYADYSRGWMAYTEPSGPGGLAPQHTVFSTNTGPIVDIRYDPYSGLMYFVNIGSGVVSRLRHVEDGFSNPPVAVAAATPTQGPAPLAVRFTGSGSFDPDGGTLTYAWAFGDGSTSSAADPEHTYTNPGTYAATLTVTNALGAESRASVQVHVTDGTLAVILEPAPLTFARPGEVVSFRAEDHGTGAAFAWNVTQIHNDHRHHDILNASGPEATFTVPTHGLPHEIVYYEITLTVTEGGVSNSTSRHLLLRSPRHFDVTLASRPVALVTSPSGFGNPNIEVIRDGVFPERGSANVMLQYDTDTGISGRARDWVGYEFDREWTFSHLFFQEGVVRPEGGFFEDLTVEVRKNGAWTEPAYVSIVEPYQGGDGESFTTHALVFAATTGDAVRIVGTPGGSRSFISVAELRTFVLAPAGDLPAPWNHSDVGSAPVPGRAAFADGAFILEGSGDAWGSADRLHMAYRTLTGDGSITARLLAIDGANPWAKGGLSIRASLDPGSPHASLWATPRHGLSFQYRATRSGRSDVAGSASYAAPAWLQLTREGRLVTAQHSADGETWSHVGQIEIDIEDTVLIGLGVSPTDHQGAFETATLIADAVTVHAGPTGSGDTGVPLRFGIQALFPNPASGGATLELSLAHPGDHTVELFDMLGRRVWRYDLHEPGPANVSATFDFASLPSGVYVLRVQDPSGETAVERLTLLR